MATQNEKDEKIIADNPGAEPYELVHLGLSDAAYQRLIKQQEADKPKAKPGAKKKAADNEGSSKDAEKATQAETPQLVAQKAAPVAPRVTRATPNTSQPAQMYSGGLALLHDTRTGKTIKMSREKAIKHARNRPHLKIVG